MPKNLRTIGTESSIARNLILESRDIYSKEGYEQRVDYQLAVLTQKFHKYGNVDKEEVKKVVEEFIKIVEYVLRELEDAKTKAEQEELKKIKNISHFLSQGTRISSNELKTEIEKFGSALKSNTISALRKERRMERRLRRGKGPRGYILKNMQLDKVLERDISRKAVDIIRDTSKEHNLTSEMNYLINQLNSNPNEKILILLGKKLKKLLEDYKRDIGDFLNIELNIGIEEARKLHKINHYITFLKKVKGFDDLIQQLKKLKKKTRYWVRQDEFNDRKLISYTKKLFKYAQDEIRISKAMNNNRVISFLNKQPLLIVFHSTNEAQLINEILSLRGKLPTSYMGRKLEYACEVDYFWLKQEGELRGFFGHAMPYLTPWTKKLFLSIVDGEYTGVGSNILSKLFRKGILPPGWLIRRMRGSGIKLMVEIKGGRGGDEKALDDLVRLINKYNSERNITLLGFSAWPLEYLKQKLPHVFTTHMYFSAPFIGKLKLPFNKLLPSLRKYSFSRNANKYSFVNAYSGTSKLTKIGDKKQIEQAAAENKFFISWKVISKMQLNRIAQFGGRGAIIWQNPKKILKWLSKPPKNIK